jgi:hypothetical protein
VVNVYDASNPRENQRQTGEVAALLRAGGMDGYDANTLALLGALPATSGQLLRQAAQSGGQSFDWLRAIVLGTVGQRIVSAQLTVQEAFARLAALGRDPSPQPVAFHCPEDGCHGRAQLMIDQLHHLGVSAASIRRVWAFSERGWGRAYPRMQPTDEAGSALRDYAGAVIEWDYHVAPAVLVEGPSNTTVLLVLDPCLFRHPADPDLWHQRAGTPRHLPRTAQVTELGVAPLHPATGHSFPGSGYRPWADPTPGTSTEDAIDLMLEIMGADAALQRPVRPLPPL